MNNIVKSVAFAAVVLVAGIAAMQFVYKNVTADEAANMEPAAGDAMATTEGAVEGAVEEVAPAASAETPAADAAAEATDAAKDAATEAADKAKEMAE